MERRGFLSGLFKAAAVAPAALAGYEIGIDKGESGGDKTAFNFQCPCGRGLVAEVPKAGESVKHNCECGTEWELTWTGEGFTTKSNRYGDGWGNSGLNFSDEAYRGYK